MLLVRTPYDKGAGMALTEKDYFPPRGYVVVVQDTRGRHSSEGDFYPFIHEARDGYDAVQWAAALPWSDGKVGMVGQSYLALVQYYAAPVCARPHLRVAAPGLGAGQLLREFRLSARRASSWDGCWPTSCSWRATRWRAREFTIAASRSAGQLCLASGHPDGSALKRDDYPPSAAFAIGASG